MYYKAIVMEIKEEYVIVMTDDASLVRIKKRDHLKEGSSIIFLEDDILKNSKNIKDIRNIIIPFMYIVAILMIIVLPSLNKKYYAVITLDINPSIQLNIDKSKKITKILRLNKDAEKINLDDIIGVKLGEGLENIKYNFEKENYKIKNDYALVGFAIIEDSKNATYEKEVKDIVRNSFKGTNTIYLSSNKKDWQQANKEGISLGRYLADKKIRYKYNAGKMNVDKIVNELKGNKKIYIQKSTEKNKEVKKEEIKVNEKSDKETESKLEINRDTDNKKEINNESEEVKSKEKIISNDKVYNNEDLNKIKQDNNKNQPNEHANENAKDKNLNKYKEKSNNGKAHKNNKNSLNFIDVLGTNTYTYNDDSYGDKVHEKHNHKNSN
ncbi:anti-sigma factor domain-containing protein [Paraclostridium sordellii]|uniref:anti-sigma factor domain-containing protein n=1 Tax=Paraclostridium sordellii TaxID=1505 RepID=UPI0005E2CE25|nr:anti-sigma factor domain-containing protein [Paeniclostridium sordellii]CEO12962.1 anti-sigma factor [[Clostridium] sordellii] [Paeniclostridium sordellii]CEP88011.1 anti-sigma factor [[Clostridium] sordellii] [Paeniclostridium sordellii]CEP97253.1 anti-sigma factor [[Clostridium] sordellii] [Paeniclostridium sordellii]CEQ00941.1 anti-sigma factor [[Clostridium] sordellii] [Paeniclostridium sordellii]